MDDREELIVDQVLKFLRIYRDAGLTIDQVIEVLEYDRSKQLFPRERLSRKP